MKDLTKEMHFSKESVTTAEEIKALAIDLLNLTWTIEIYRFKPASVINLLDLGWCFEFNDRKRAAGLCSRTKKTIYISKWLLEQNLDKALKFEDTIRHEIAHAIDNEVRGFSNHDKVWKLIAIKILCNGERCYEISEIQTKVETKYKLVCPKDDCTFERASHKKRPLKPRTHPCCNDCHKKGRGYVRLVQVQNY